MFQRKKEKKRGLISPQHSPTPTGRFGSLIPDNRMAWRKRSRGGVKRICVFIRRPPPPPSHSLQSVWKISLVRVCVRAASSEGLHLEQGGACKGSRVASRAKQNRSSPSSQEGQMSPAAASHEHVPFTHPFLPFPSSPSSLVYLFSLLLWKDAVIHNPLNYQRLNYPSRLSIFSPRMEIPKQLTSSRLGTFPRKGHGGNWMTPQFTFLTMTSLLHA